jgi:hypothetical protein
MVWCGVMFSPSALTPFPSTILPPPLSLFSEWTTAVQAAKQFLDATCAPDAAWCPLTINAWNEWSEGAYIEPDVRYGTAKLEAIKAVFGSVEDRRGYATMQ